VLREFACACAGAARQPPLGVAAFGRLTGRAGFGMHHSGRLCRRVPKGGAGPQRGLQPPAIAGNERSKSRRRVAVKVAPTGARGARAEVPALTATRRRLRTPRGPSRRSSEMLTRESRSAPHRGGRDMRALAGQGESWVNGHPTTASRPQRASARAQFRRSFSGESGRGAFPPRTEYEGSVPHVRHTHVRGARYARAASVGEPGTVLSTVGATSG